jgi:solute carrier family 10 (sodium/bile acid cotransporter), member 7
MAVTSLPGTVAAAPRPVDGFIVALALVVLAASVLPCRGASADLFRALGQAAIAALFFLQGARLSREAILHGMTHWRLHAIAFATTFAVFPLAGLVLFVAAPHGLPHPLWLGVIFACALPSTVQSSIALTSIARGNVAAAVCAASMSNIAGIALTPLIFGAVSKLYGGGVNLSAVGQVLAQLLLPFIAGHLLRPWIGAWAARNRSLLAITDRGSILLVVYAAFSAAVVRGIWHQVPPTALAIVALLLALLLCGALLTMLLASRALGLSRADEVALVFCGSQKSLVTGVPMANALFSAGAIGPILLPIMLYHPMQLLVCSWIARYYARRAAASGA